MPSLFDFAPDLVPLTEPEIGLYLNRLHAMSGEMATWAAAQTDDQLAATLTEQMPADGLAPFVRGERLVSLPVAADRRRHGARDAKRRAGRR